MFWWGLNGTADVDWFGAWTHDPTLDMSDATEIILFAGEENGQLKFLVEIDYLFFPNDVSLVEESTCLPYWVGYVEKDELVFSDCLKLHPHWMKTMQEKNLLAGVNLIDIGLPGTHDAAAANQYKNWTNDGLVESITSEWTFTHHNGIYKQLVLGTRYIDIRIGYYPEKEHQYYINHGVVFIVPLYIVLQDVEKFMSETAEIVIFDIHGLEHDFTGYEEALPGLKMLIESYLVQWMLPRQFQTNPTLDAIWATDDKRLIVTYPGDANSDLYWDSVYHLWADANNLQDLTAYHDSGIPDQSANSNKLWSVMAQFTATAVDVSLNRWGGLEGAAVVTNFPMNTKLRQDWWTMTNIFSMDFLQGSAVVDTVIQANEMKFTCLLK